MIRASLSLAALAALALAGCNNGGQGAVVTGFCPDFNHAGAVQAAPLAVTDANASPAVECVRRWAYALAPSRDAASLVAQAAVAACDGRLGAWNQSTMQGAGGGASPDTAMSILTGAPTNPVAEHDTFLHGRALLYVVAARAGHCAPPKIVNGAPQGA